MGRDGMKGRRQWLPQSKGAAPAVRGLPEEILQAYGITAGGFTDECLEVTGTEPLESEARAEIYLATGCEVRWRPAPERIEPRATRPMVQDPVVSCVEELLGEAVALRAADLHLEPMAEGWRVRARVDGLFRELRRLDFELGRAVISHLKVRAELNLAEARVPQDGSFRWQEGDRRWNIRIATLPTLSGEAASLRFPDLALGGELGDLGFDPVALAAVEELLVQPAGLLAVTGPTGSGKTTTVYAMLRRLSGPHRKLVSVEDPVERELADATQVAVQPQGGLTFAGAIRGFLRQDPDVIFVGEIRDAETAKAAVQAALTGHLVLTTLHTRDAAGSVSRLLALGVEPSLLASVLRGVVAQRLVRRLCRYCGGAAADLCRKCGGAGFDGRRLLCEVLPVSEPVRALIGISAGREEIQAMALRSGMHSLMLDGERLVREGETTWAELRRHLPESSGGSGW